MFQCPVCGYDRLRRPPEDYLICACCGTEFGYDDFADTHEGRQHRWDQLRQRWIDRGMRWFSPVTQPPPGWDAEEQLLAAGLVSSLLSDASEDTITQINVGVLAEVA